MMRHLLVICGLLLIIGPLRKPLLSQWRLILPLTIGGIIGFIILGRFMPGAPRWMLWFGPFFSAFLIGGAVRELFDDWIPPKGK